LCSLLEKAADIDIVARVADGEEAIRLAKQLTPHVAIIDVALSDIDVTKACERIKVVCPTTAILILCTRADESQMLACLKGGAAGYLPSDTDPHDLISAIYTIRSGEAVVDLETIRMAVRHIGVLQDETKAPELLQRREVEVLKLAAEGFSNKQIAAKLGISERTVQSHMVHIFTKLGVASRTEAVLQALRKGWLTFDDLDKAKPS